MSAGSKKYHSNQNVGASGLKIRPDMNRIGTGFFLKD